MNQHADFLVAGGGLAGATAIKTLLSAGVPGTRIALVSAEHEVPYHRPPLSKGYFLGRESKASLFVKPRSFYEQAGVRLILGTSVSAVNANAHTVTTDRFGTIRYGKLLLATGCVLRRLTVPGSDLHGIFYLRTLADSDALKNEARPGRTAVVMGGSFIGMELASGFAQKGLKTTLLHRGSAVFDKLGSPEASTFFARHYTERGVLLRMEEEAAAFAPHPSGDGSLEIRMTRGDTLRADIVAVGIGVTPDTSFLQGSGITVENGVIVNEYLEASVPDVYAAGDIAHFFDPLYERHRRIEHWDTAIQHGKIAGANMAGKREAYDQVSYFFSDVFDLSFEYFGDAAETDQIILRGLFEEASVTVFYLRDRVVRAAFTMGRPKERAALVRLLKSRHRFADPAVLADSSRSLGSHLDTAG